MAADDAEQHARHAVTRQGTAKLEAMQTPGPSPKHTELSN
jgi:hypothetical protein